MLGEFTFEPFLFTQRYRKIIASLLILVDIWKLEKELRNFEDSENEKDSSVKNDDT